MSLKIFIVILLFPSFAFCDEWTKTDTALQATFSTLLIADWNQTLKISDTKYYERNDILGKYPSRGKVNRYFAGTLIGHYFVAKWLNKPWRNIWQSFWIGTEYSVITHNKRNGFKVSLSF